MNQNRYTLFNLVKELPNTLASYIEAQYHIWDEYLVGERHRLLHEPGVIFHQPYIEATPSYLPGEVYSRLAIPTVIANLLSTAAQQNTGIPVRPYRHQAKALEEYFTRSKELVVSTGTGSGKTESFLMPIIGSLAIERSERAKSYESPAVRAIILYPMNALVNDQMARLRRLLAAPSVSQALARENGSRATIGMYTSRTLYPGKHSPNKTKELVGGWIDSWCDRYSSQREQLTKQGKWPAKDLDAFKASFDTSNDGFQTSITDTELLTRHEMHRTPPDILVTNYSMLEYMLLRPIESPIFSKTAHWLEDPRNQLTVVLDEAHLYQGAQGSEVALLLRRLISRLRIERKQVRFILTSASLAEGENSEAVIKAFAHDLTGWTGPSDRFAIVQGELDRPTEGRAGRTNEAESFAAIDVSALHGVANDLTRAHQAIASLFSNLVDSAVPKPTNASDLQNAVYELLSCQPVAIQLASMVMAKPTPYLKLANELFPGQAGTAEKALDGLLAVSAFAKRATDQKVWIPSRAHFLFRGVEGIYACINSACTAREDISHATRLGRLYSRPQLRCDCGSRVYELLTHRDCGAAYLRGYFNPNNPDFLWHEASTGRSTAGEILDEIHLLVEWDRDQAGNSNDIWLHTLSGRVLRNSPSSTIGYLRLQESGAQPVLIAGRNVVTFDKECPVCLGRWQHQNRPKIMDLTTKGEDPFAHLIATQFRLQPEICESDAKTPNGGRKSLLFSDGRQKAARLARDVPRVLEQDAFRQVLLLAAAALRAVSKEPRLDNPFFYVAFLSIVIKYQLQFFDTDDAQRLRDHIDDFRRWCDGDIESAFSTEWSTPTPPTSFRVQMLKALGSRHYSIAALGLGYVQPRKATKARLQKAMTGLGLSDDDSECLYTVWIQKLLGEMSLYSDQDVQRMPRAIAAGHPIDQIGSTKGFTRKQTKFLKGIVDLQAVEKTLFDHLTSPTAADPDYRVLKEGELVVVSAIESDWYRCIACSHLSPVHWRGNCISCGTAGVKTAQHGQDEYLRARKDFWRAPTERVLKAQDRPLTMSVEEHTAQLSHRDQGKTEATTESFERRFRDILIDREIAIDVLSCTTTMEVGIDIGSLIAVGMRNMPPSRHNYQQRAGRAGRRGSAISTVITYAQNNPHDSYLFENPEALISGAPHLTGLDITNPRLIERHAYAEILQEFFNTVVLGRNSSNVFDALGRTSDFFKDRPDESLNNLNDWLMNDDDAKGMLRRIDKWLPPDSGLTARFCANSLVDKLRDLTDVARGSLPQDEEQLIEFLFARGILPAYAFPRDLIALQIEKVGKNRQGEIVERPQQGAGIALSEYAPGRTVVVNKKTYRIGAVTAATSNDSWDRSTELFASQFRYLQCASCVYTEDLNPARESIPCPVCGTNTLEVITAIQPEVVWPEDRGGVGEFDDDPTMTDTTLAQLPVPSSDEKFETPTAFGHGVELKYGRQVPLVVLNRGPLESGQPGGFYVCDKCGVTTPAGVTPIGPNHERPYLLPARGMNSAPRRCNGIQRHVFLGYQFETDVLLMHMPLRSPFLFDLTRRETRPALLAALNSLANSLALTAASELDVDARELQCGVRLQRRSQGDSFADIYIYDTLAGGAGYSRMVGDRFSEFFTATLERLRACTCDSSCTNCLRTYGNRMLHASLNRHLALDLAQYVQLGAPPAQYDLPTQRALLMPLKAMLELDGWTVIPKSPVAYEIAKDKTRRSVVLIPSLFDSQCVPDEWRSAIAFSQYDIENDLPSCLLKLP